MFQPRLCPAATDKMPGANAVEASFPHRISSDVTSVTGPWLLTSDRSLTKKLSEKNWVVGRMA